jgi:hypothetical protein
LLILDAGSGIFPLGESLHGSGTVEGSLFITRFRISAIELNVAGDPCFLPGIMSLLVTRIPLTRRVLSNIRSGLTSVRPQSTALKNIGALILDYTDTQVVPTTL